MPKKILFALGGTGGHLFPAIKLAKELEGHEIFFAGSGLKDNGFLKAPDIPFYDVAASTPFANPLKAGIDLSKGTWQALKVIKNLQPDLVIGFGSFHSVPVLAAVSLKKIPILLFEPNATLGRANRLFAKKASLFAVQFEEASRGLPSKLLEFPIIDLNVAQEARLEYGLDPELSTLLVFGGSQGAQFFNQELSKITLEIPFQVLHLAGKKADCQAIKKNWKVPAAVVPFEENMVKAYSAATIAICRAGASTLSELIATQTPSVLIPYPYAYAHQAANARELEKIGGAKILFEKQATPEKVSVYLQDVFQRREEMKENLKTFKLREARQKFSTIVLEV